MRLVVAVVLAAVLAAAAARAQQNYVFLVSIDGLRADYLLRADELGARVPNLRALIADGVLADGALTVTPAVTYPSHTSMISGVVPNRHGVLYNSKFDPEGVGRGGYYFEYDIEADTIFRAAKRQGVSVSGVNWPTSCGPSLDFNVPDAFGRDEQELLYLLDGCCRGPISDVIRGPADFDNIGDAERVVLAEAFIAAGPQRLTAVHISELDAAQHSYGVFSDAAFEALEEQDAHLGRIVDAIDRAGVRNQSTIIVVSDHGFVNVTRQTAPGVLLTERGLTQQPWKAYPYAASGSLAIYVADENDVATKAEVTEIVGILLRGDYGVARAWFGAEAEALGGWRGAFVVLEAEVGTTLSGSISGSLSTPIALRGIHGHTPFTYPELRASFVASGYGVRRGAKIGTVSLVDVAPTIAQLLGLSLATSPLDGRVLDEIFF